MRKYHHTIGSNLYLELYDYNECIKYLKKMFSCLDASRIVEYGIHKLCQHLFLIYIHLKEIHKFLFDHDLANEVYSILDQIQEFYNEFSYDVNRHRIGHIGWEIEQVFPYEENSYGVENTDNIHIFNKFTKYIIFSLENFILIKTNLLNISESVCDGNHEEDLQYLKKEIHSYTALKQELIDIKKFINTSLENIPSNNRKSELLTISKAMEEKHSKELLNYICNSLSRGD